VTARIDPSCASSSATSTAPRHAPSAAEHRERRSKHERHRCRQGGAGVEDERLSTAGGLTARIDLALRVVERYFDRAAAEAVAEHLEYQGRGWIAG